MLFNSFSFVLVNNNTDGERWSLQPDDVLQPKEANRSMLTSPWLFTTKDQCPNKSPFKSLRTK